MDRPSCCTRSPAKRWRRAATPIRIEGANVGHLGPAGRRARGLAFVPEERLGRGAVAELSLADNALAHRLSRSAMSAPAWCKTGAVRDFATAIVRNYNVVCAGIDAEARSLSGGNMQKFIIGREILQQPRVLIAAHPTWGVDVGAALTIHEALIRLRDAGAAVLVVSEDLDELFEICDRIAVMSKGRVSEPKRVGETDIDEIGLLMGGLFARQAAGSVACRGLGSSRAPNRRASTTVSVAAPGGGADAYRRRGACSRFSAATRLQAYRAFFIDPVSTLYGVGELGVKGAPLILCAIGLAIGFRANVWNIGAEGQFILGAICGRRCRPVPTSRCSDRLTMPAMFIAGALGGLIWAAIPALSRPQFNANEILTSLMLTYVAEPVAALSGARTVARSARLQFSAVEAVRRLCGDSIRSSRERGSGWAR